MSAIAAILAIFLFVRLLAVIDPDEIGRRAATVCYIVMFAAMAVFGFAFAHAVLP